MATQYSGFLYRAEQVRLLDRLVVKTQAIESYQLMQRAGRAVYEFISHEYPGFVARAARVLVVCGGGKNGGDGYVIARLLHQAGYNVDLLALIAFDKLETEVLTAAQDWRSCGRAELNIRQLDMTVYDLVVDALLGTGLQRPVTGEFAQVVEQINLLSCPVIAVDIPSGLHADRGQPLPIAVIADHTITFIAAKQGLYTGRAADYCGRIHFAGLEAPGEIYSQILPSALLIEAQNVLPSLPLRRPTAHKGESGHLLAIGGDVGMQGAVQMAGIAALRCGAGLVSLATRGTHAAVLSAYQPELMSHPVERLSDLKPLLTKATAIALGPGLGQTAWARKLFAAALHTKLPLVMDADGLNLLAAKPLKRTNWILTPHSGEAARLLNVSTDEIQADRYAAVSELAARYTAVVVLKGAGTLIAAPGESCVWVCNRGHPAMASGGMGDILTGMVAGLLAQRMDLLQAAKAAVWLHACAAEQAVAAGGQGLLATDLLPELRHLLNHAGI